MGTSPRTCLEACVSRHLEYAYQDFCIATLADTLGQTDVARRYYEGAKKIWNLWHEDIRFFAPRRPDGRWVEPFDPAYCIPESWFDPYFYEGTSWQWSFSVHHDFAGLIERCGGRDAFVRRLDEFFDRGYYHSKETILHVPYLYIYAGRPDKTADRVRACLAKYFEPTRDGLKDNEDMGCQSAFYMCSTMGLYPIMGQDLYLLTTPVFPRTEITLGASGRKLIIEAPDAGPEKGYIRSVTLNGKPLDRAWICHGEIADGASLRVELAAEPEMWGTSIPPPHLPGKEPGHDVESKVDSDHHPYTGKNTIMSELRFFIYRDGVKQYFNPDRPGSFRLTVQPRPDGLVAVASYQGEGEVEVHFGVELPIRVTDFSYTLIPGAFTMEITPSRQRPFQP